MRHVLSFAVLFSLLGSLPDVALGQTTWYVDAAAVPPGNGSAASPYASLQYAIAQPTTVGGDRLEVAPGTYAEAIDFLGKAIAVVGTTGAGATVIDGGGFLGGRSAVVFENGEGRDSVLQGFTVTRGTGTYDPVTNFELGGGLLLSGASPTIRDCVVTGNEADIGGGLYGNHASPHLVDTTVAANYDPSHSLPYMGGGVAIEVGSPEFDRVVIDGNVTDGNGAGVWLMDARASLRGCVLSFNYSDNGDGGGLFARASVVTLERCKIIENLVFDGGQGGGLLVAAGARVTAVACSLEDNVADTDHLGGGASVAPGGQLVFLGGTIAGNFSGGGGGIHSEGTTFVSDCTLADNVAQAFQAGSGSGGAVEGRARLLRCLITGNRAYAGFGGATGVGGGTFGASLEHCTLVGNTADLSSGGAYAAPTAHNSIFWGNLPATLGAAGTVSWCDVEGGHRGAGNLDADPLFVDPANGDYHLSAGSPCIDAGDPSSPLDPDGTRTDMGAFPFHP